MILLSVSLVKAGFSMRLEGECLHKYTANVWTHVLIYGIATLVVHVLNATDF
jgi:hypothetical protein